MPSVATPSKAGIIEDPTGERHIPSSIRADGSKRKEIKIRPGYKPPEDVEVYKNRTAESFRTRGSGDIPGAEGLKNNEAGSSSALNKNAKRREARKKAKSADGTAGGSSVANGDKSDAAKVNLGSSESKREDAVDPEVEREKKARNLKKKLKQAKELKEKKEEGAALLPEQFAKVIKINELIRELDALGFDADGEPKDKVEVAA
jgi:partner of Y14 and mago protein